VKENEEYFGIVGLAYDLGHLKALHLDWHFLMPLSIFRHDCCADSISKSWTLMHMSSRRIVGIKVLDFFLFQIVED
jgi:hypothetical protein